MIVTEDTEHTSTIQLDLRGDSEQSIEIDGKVYKIKLVNIGKEEINGQDFPFFELKITT